VILKAKLIMINNNSTGPRTDAGKQTSSRNAVKHGCCSTETLILATESIEDFKALEAIWFQSYSPKDDFENHLLNQVVQADWFLQRATRTLAGVEAQFLSEVPTPTDMYDCHHVALQRFMRYQTTRRNEFTKAKKALDDHRKMQATEKRNEENQEIAKVKLAIYKEKNKPKPTFEETIAEMTRTAEALGFKPKTDPTIK
jgi:hypothetical protein